MEKVNVSLAHQIRFIRELEGFSQDSIARYLGISQQAYQKMECGRARICKARLKQIAEFLAVDEQALIEVKKEDLLSRYKNKKQTNVKERLKQEVQSIRRELNVLRQLNERILNELERA